MSNLKGRHSMGGKMVRCKSCIKFKDRTCLVTGEKRSGGRHRVCEGFTAKMEVRLQLPYLPWNWKEQRKERIRLAKMEAQKKAELGSLVRELEEATPPEAKIETKSKVEAKAKKNGFWDKVWTKHKKDPQ